MTNLFIHEYIISIIDLLTVFIITSKFIILLTIIILMIIQIIIKPNINKQQNFSPINENYIKTNDINLLFPYLIKSKIKVGIYLVSIKNGGIERLTSLLINYLSKITFLELYLFTQIKEKNEYKIPENISRTITKYNINNLIREAKKKIDILIYNLYHYEEINILNNIKEFKTIFYNHSCFLFWIYAHSFDLVYSLYTSYKKAKYVISLVPFENDYIFKKWGINSILMDNFITYEYNKVIPSDLKSKIILMIGRASDKYKRFDLGIKSMKYIIKKVPQSKMIIISDLNDLDYMHNLIRNLTLDNHIKFVGYTNSPEIYYKNASLHIFPTISESFGLVMCETKIFGIPNIIVGIDYISPIIGGTIIIYDDNPESIAVEAIKILNNDTYRIKLGNDARKSMKTFHNNLTLNKWVNLILAIYNGKQYYDSLRLQEIKIKEKDAKTIMQKQIKLLKMRDVSFKNISIRDIENFTLLINYFQKIKNS